MFAELGAGIVDTDIVAREVVAPGETGLTAIKEAFGSRVLLGTGELDRGAMREIVFQDAAERARLESILHPLIRQRTLAQVDALNTPYGIVVVPLLVETSFNEIVDRVLVVDCPRDVQLERLIQRDGITRDTAESMLAAQSKRNARKALADDIMGGSVDLDSAREQCRTLHERYLALAKSASRHA